jgi:putative aldouronate transport system permease protein
MKMMAFITRQVSELYREIHKNRYLYLLALPGLIWLLIFAYLPMVGHVIAFKNFRAPRGVFGSDFFPPDQIFRNFEFFFSSGDWLRVSFNTIFLNLLFLVVGMSTALILSIFLNEIRLVIVKRVAQSVVLLPHFFSWLVVSIMFFALFNTADGLVNRTLITIGLKPVMWYSIPWAWPFLLTLVDIWKGTGFTSIIFLAAITAIPEELYESAVIDGANKFQKMRYITLPLLIPTAIILALLALGRIFYGNFEMIYSLVGENGTLFSTTNVIDTYTFRALRQLGNFGMTAAVGLYQAFLGLLAVLFFNWLVRRIDSERSLF